MGANFFHPYLPNIIEGIPITNGLNPLPVVPHPTLEYNLFFCRNEVVRRKTRKHTLIAAKFNLSMSLVKSNPAPIAEEHRFHISMRRIIYQLQINFEINQLIFYDQVLRKVSDENLMENIQLYNSNIFERDRVLLNILYCDHTIQRKRCGCLMDDKLYRFRDSYYFNVKIEKK